MWYLLWKECFHLKFFTCTFSARSISSPNALKSVKLVDNIYLIHQWSVKDYKQCHPVSYCAVPSQFDFFLLHFNFSLSFSCYLFALALHHNSKQHHSVLNVAAMNCMRAHHQSPNIAQFSGKMLLYVCWRRKQMSSDVSHLPTTESIKSLKHFVPTYCLVFLCQL